VTRGWSMLFSVVVVSAMTAAGSRAGMPEEIIDANVLVIKAEQAERQGNLAEAAALYRRSVKRFGDVAKAHPDWKPELVRYRIAQSENQATRLDAVIKAVDRQIDGLESAATPIPAAGTDAGITPADAKPVAPDTRDEEIALLEDGLQKREQENLDLRHQLEDAAEAAQSMTEQITALAGTTAALSNEIRGIKADLDEKSGELATARAGVDAAAVARVAAEQERDSLVNRMEELRAGHETTVGQLKMELDVLNDRLAERDAEHAQHQAAISEAEALRRTNEELQSKVARLEQEIAGFQQAGVQQVARIEGLKADDAEQAAFRSRQEERIRELERQLENAEGESRKWQEQASSSAEIHSSQTEASRQIAALTNELAVLRKESARINLEFESAVKLNQEYDRARRELEAERNRLLAQMNEHQQKNAAAGTVADPRIEQLADENEQLKREVDGLNHTIERIQQKNATGKLRAQNSALIEENRVLRAHLSKLETQVKQLDNQLRSMGGKATSN